MQHQEKQKTDDPSSDGDEADDGVNDDHVKNPYLSAEATRSKSEQDLARTYSLDLLMVCQCKFVLYGTVLNRRHGDILRVHACTVNNVL